MHTKILHHFWSDEKIEDTAPETKLAALWLMTQSGLTVFGYGKFTLTRFHNETGLSRDALGMAFDALPRIFERVGENGYWIRTYIRHQFGGGPTLLANTISKAIVRGVQALGIPMLSARVQVEYPVLIPLFAKPPSPMPIPSPQGGVREEKEKEKEKNQGECEGERVIGASEAGVSLIWSRVCAIFGRKPGIFAPNDVEHALAKVSVSSAELDLLAAFVPAALSTEESIEKWHPRETADRLALNLAAELDKARRWARETGWKPAKAEPVSLEPEPENWQKKHAGRWPEAVVPESWEKMPGWARKELICSETTTQKPPPHENQ